MSIPASWTSVVEWFEVPVVDLGRCGSRGGEGRGGQLDLRAAICCGQFSPQQTGLGPS